MPLITAELLSAGILHQRHFTREQMQILGAPWPPGDDWREQVISRLGIEITSEDAARFIAIRKDDDDERESRRIKLNDLIQSMLDNPDDNLIPLIIADMLDENNEWVRAAFVRVQMAKSQLANNRCMEGKWEYSRDVLPNPGYGYIPCKKCDDCLYSAECHKYRSEYYLWKDIVGNILGLQTEGREIAEFTNQWQWESSRLRLYTSRGFVTLASGPLSEFFVYSPLLFESQPVRTVVVTSLSDLNIKHIPNNGMTVISNNKDSLEILDSDVANHHEDAINVALYRKFSTRAMNPKPPLNENSAVAELIRGVHEGIERCRAGI